MNELKVEAVTVLTFIVTGVLTIFNLKLFGSPKEKQQSFIHLRPH